MHAYYSRTQQTSRGMEMIEWDTAPGKCHTRSFSRSCVVSPHYHSSSTQPPDKPTTILSNTRNPFFPPLSFNTKRFTSKMLRNLRPLLRTVPAPSRSAFRPLSTTPKAFAAAAAHGGSPVKAHSVEE